LQIRHITQRACLEQLLIARQVLVQGLAQQAGLGPPGAAGQLGQAVQRGLGYRGFVTGCGERNTMSQCRRNDDPRRGPAPELPADGWVSP
jgi:hypothetical protein